MFDFEGLIFWFCLHGLVWQVLFSRFGFLGLVYRFDVVCLVQLFSLRSSSYLS